MGNYENLKQSITEVIRTNGNQEITGAVLQSTLLTIISTVGANATFAGIATPTTNPGTPDGPVFYLASESGTYSNFGSIELQDGLSVLMWNGSWNNQQIFGIDDVPTAGSDNLVKSGGVAEELALGIVYDVSAKNPTAGVNNDGKWESLSALLSDTNLSTLIPTPVRKGGMSIKFVQSSDNKYVQWRSVTETFSVRGSDWEMFNAVSSISTNEADLDISDGEGNVLVKFQNGNIQTKSFDSSQDATKSKRGLMSASDKAKLNTIEQNAEVNDVETKDNSSSDLDISDENGNILARFIGGELLLKSTIKHIDCLGDSLTAGSAVTGWYEDKLQELVGSGYTVRNWGVGGENVVNIMSRQGSTSIVFDTGFTLPQDTSQVELPIMRGMYSSMPLTLLRQGEDNVINPCFLGGIECIMTYNSGTEKYFIRRKEAGNRIESFTEKAQLLLNTGKEMGKSFISIVWMGENDLTRNPTTAELDYIINGYKRVIGKLSNQNYIFIGLHNLSGDNVAYFENNMYDLCGTKFFNIREYCCTNLLYDAGITPTSQDLEDMSEGKCPQSALYDGVHFLPATNNCIGKRLYEMCYQLGYLN